MLRMMLKRAIKRFARKLQGKDSLSIEQAMAEASRQTMLGNLPKALTLYEQVVERDPSHPWALVELGNTLYKLNRIGESTRCYELALAIDDSFAPALVNLALRCNASYDSSRAIELLERAREVAPHQPHVDATLASTFMSRGDPKSARQYHLSAWLKKFDAQEPAHCFLFCGSYCDDWSASDLVAEHAFWASTLQPAPFHPPAPNRRALEGRKLRIGYLSPDFRNHSVRYFFRPLIEGHDRSRVEVYCYYDNVGEDEQTRRIKAHADVFRDVANLPDQVVAETILDDQLDALVELAGHTSISRLHVLKHRLATLQLTGLGYPPTTGLASIDFKIVDAISAPPDSGRFYTERLLHLPQSFWCFNPNEVTPDPTPPPSMESGFVRFACFGNPSKISDGVLDLWARILHRVPSSRMVIKALTFEDSATTLVLEARMRKFGLDLGRVTLEQPSGPSELFGVYNSVDIVLDTFPFTGGTTSCFALWMGTPIITLLGDALGARMSASMLALTGLDDCIAATPDEYVECAVALASNKNRLAEIKSTLRTRMKTCALGDGKLYAQHLEDAIFAQLRSPTEEGAATTHAVLSAGELCKRAQFVLLGSQVEAAQRIVDYTLQLYPREAAAFILQAQIQEISGRTKEAEHCLTRALEVCDAESHASLRVNQLRLLVTQRRFDEALCLPRPADLDPSGFAQDRLCRTIASVALGQRSSDNPKASVLPRLHVIVRSESESRRRLMTEALASVLAPGMFTIETPTNVGICEAISQADLDKAIDAVVILDEDHEPLGRNLHQMISEALDEFDIASCGGSTEVCGANWKDARFDDLIGSIVYPAQAGNAPELCIFGPHRTAPKLAVRMVNPAFLVIRRTVLESLKLDRALDGDHGLALVDLAIRASTSGFRIGAHAGMLFVQHQPDKRGSNWHASSQRLRQTHGIEETQVRVYDPLRAVGASAPLVSATLAEDAVLLFYQSSIATVGTTEDS